MEKLWLGKPPEKCDLCGRKILSNFTDGRTKYGPWAIMCPSCRIDQGLIELGTGRGQAYTARGFGAERVWVKTGG